MESLPSWIAFWTSIYLASTSVTLLRLVIRQRLKRLARSDALTLLCLALSTILFSVAIYTGAIGFGTRAVTAAEYKRLVLQVFFYYITAMVLVPLSKVCVTLLLLEVEINDNWRRCLKIVQGLILLTALINVTLCFFGCYTPYDSGFWGVLAQDGVSEASNQIHQSRCVVRQELVPINGGLNVIYEICIFVCAMSLVFRVKTTVLQKLGLACSFALGFLTIAASIMNLYVNLDGYLRQVHHLPVGSYYIWRSGLWIAVEANTGLIVASLLPIRSTLLHFFDDLLSAGRRPKVFSDDSYASGRSQNQAGTIEYKIEIEHRTEACAV